MQNHSDIYLNYIEYQTLYIAFFKRGDLIKELKAYVVDAKKKGLKHLIFCSDLKVLQHIPIHFLKLKIEKAGLFGAKLIFFHVKEVSSIIPVYADLFWVDEIRGSKFFVVCESFFETILSTEILSRTSLDEFLSNSTSNKILVCSSLNITTVDLDLQIIQRIKSISRKFTKFNNPV